MDPMSIQSTLDNIVQSIDRVIEHNTKEIEEKRKLINLVNFLTHRKN